MTRGVVADKGITKIAPGRREAAALSGCGRRRSTLAGAARRPRRTPSGRKDRSDGSVGDGMPRCVNERGRASSRGRSDRARPAHQGGGETGPGRPRYALPGVRSGAHSVSPCSFGSATPTTTSDAGSRAPLTRSTTRTVASSIGVPAIERLMTAPVGSITATALACRRSCERLEYENAKLQATPSEWCRGSPGWPCRPRRNPPRALPARAHGQRSDDNGDPHPPTLRSSGVHVTSHAVLSERLGWNCR